MPTPRASRLPQEWDVRKGPEHWPSKGQREAWLWSQRKAWEQAWLCWEGRELARVVLDWKAVAKCSKVCQKVVSRIQHLELAVGYSKWEEWHEEHMHHAPPCATTTHMTSYEEVPLHGTSPSPQPCNKPCHPILDSKNSYYWQFIT